MSFKFFQPTPYFESAAPSQYTFSGALQKGADTEWQGFSPFRRGTIHTGIPGERPDPLGPLTSPPLQRGSWTGQPRTRREKPRDPFKSEDWTDYGSPDDERPVNYAAPAAPATPAEKEQERKDALKGAAAATAGLGTGAAGRGLEPSGGLETYGRGGVASGDPTGGFGKGKEVGRRGHGRIAARAAAKRRKEQQEQQ